MSRSLLLDVDDVLLAFTMNRPKLKVTGFDDWRKLDKPRPDGWGGFYSQQQLDLILSVFSRPDDRIYWLTTWEVSHIGDSANRSFSDEIGWPHHHSIPNVTCSYDMALGRDDRWWKRDVVHAMLCIEHESVMADQVIWVDNELVFTERLNCRNMLGMHDASERFWMVAPRPVWSRQDIEHFR